MGRECEECVKKKPCEKYMNRSLQAVLTLPDYYEKDAILYLDKVNMIDKSEIIIYQTDDGLTKIDVRLDEDTVWLTQAEMAELFQKNVSTISRHIQSVFEEGELQKNECNLRFLQIANSDKPIALYSLDVIISVGYRVKSLRGTQFRIWTTQY